MFDANGLLESYVRIFRKGSAEERIRFQYEEWCYGHVGENILEMVQLPGGAVFRTDAEGNFTDVAYLWKKNGEGSQAIKSITMMKA